MRILVTAVLLVFVALPAFPAIQYEFSQRNTSDDSVSPARDLSARAVIEGKKSRIDFLAGTMYPPGTYVISTDGSRRLYFVDPDNKWYTEFDMGSVATSLATSNIQIQNFKSNLQDLGADAVIAGIETKHFRLTISYDISMTVRGLPLRLGVDTEIDSWITSKFGEVLNNAVSSVWQTGNPELDKLFAAETSRIKGFPLRQMVTTRTRYDLPSAARSELKVAPSRKVVREMWVTDVREVPSTAATFALPAGFRRSDAQDVPRAVTDVLTFGPAQ